MGIGCPAPILAFPAASACSIVFRLMVVILSAAKNPFPWIIHEEKNGFLGRKLPLYDKMKAKQRSRSGTVLRTLPFCACFTKSVSCELQRAFGAIKCFLKLFIGVQYQPSAFLWRAGEPGPYGGCGVRGRPMTAPTMMRAANDRPYHDAGGQ